MAQRTPEISVVLAVHRPPRGQGYIKATTWAVRNGVYGSIGVVKIPCVDLPDPEDADALAATLLTALYGLDYDL